MTIAIWALATYSIVATATHLGSILIATSKCRKPRSLSRPAESQTALGLLGLTRYLRRTGRRATRARDCTHAPSDAAGVSLVRPICGMENYIEDTLRSAFHLDYPRQPEAQQRLQGLARGRVRLDRDGGQQRLDAARLHRAPARGWARGYRRRQLAARRRPSTGILGRARMRVPQYLPVAMAIYLGRDRVGLCPGQVDALSAQPDRAGRRHSIARRRGRGGRGHDQSGARLGTARPPRRGAVRAAPRLPLRGRSMGASTAVGEAAAGLVSAVLCAGDFERQSRPAHGGRLCRRGAAPAFGQRRCIRGHMVWRRGRARARSRLASEPQIARRLDAA